MYRWIATSLILLTLEMSLTGCSRQPTDSEPATGAPPASADRPTKPAVASRPPAKLHLDIPAGTALTVALVSALSTKTAHVGDPFAATTTSDLLVDGQVALRSGARLTGTVTEVKSGSNSIGAIPTLGLRINQIELTNGNTIPLTGDLVETGKSEKGRDTAKIVGGAAAGTIIGNQAKHNDRGKIIGGLLGGAIGTIAAKKTGTEVELAAGSTLTVTTGSPFTVEITPAAAK